MHAATTGRHQRRRRPDYRRAPRRHERHHERHHERRPESRYAPGPLLKSRGGSVFESAGAQGAGTAVDFGLALVRLLLGQPKAAEVAHGMMLELETRSRS